MSKPITPKEVAKRDKIPAAVFDVFNRFIERNFTGNRAVVQQPDVVEQLVAMGYSRRAIFEEHLLDVESAYDRAGWKVTYEKPGFNESGDSFFVFEVK